MKFMERVAYASPFVRNCYKDTLTPEEYVNLTWEKSVSKFMTVLMVIGIDILGIVTMMHLVKVN